MNDHEHQHPHGHDHDHAHGHDHDHDDPFHVHATRELNIDEFDPANRSLAEALRISFGILKIVVIVLLILLLVVGGYREVKDGQVAIKLRFGAPQGEWLGQGAERHFAVEVLKPGPHFALPEPIDRLIIVPTKEQSLTIESRKLRVMNPQTGGEQTIVDTGFWFEMRDEDATKKLEEITPRGAGLTPGRDGSLITADHNIVHGKWKINYRIEDAAAFARHVGSTDITESLRRAEDLVRQSAECAIVHVVAQTSVEDFVGSNVDSGAIRELTNARLASVPSGIIVNEVLLQGNTPPLKVLDAFNAVNQAQSEKAKQIEEAGKEAEQTLTETAGRANRALMLVIDYYEQAVRERDAWRMALGRDALNALLAERTVAEALEPLASDERMATSRFGRIIDELSDARVGGAVSERIKQAEADRRNLKAVVQSEYNAFRAQYEKFAGDPQLERIVRQRLWQDTVQEVFRNAREVFYLPRDASELYIVLGSNPEIRRMSESEASRKQLGSSE